MIKLKKNILYNQINHTCNVYIKGTEIWKILAMTLKYVNITKNFHISRIS